MPSGSNGLFAGTPTTSRGCRCRDRCHARKARPCPSDSDSHTKFPATHRAQDRHLARSCAELLIDNWLDHQGLIHADERRLPIEQETDRDFDLSNRGQDVSIEDWGLDDTAKSAARKATKQSLYASHNFRLIELTDADIERLDDVVPRVLLRFGIDCG